MTLSCLERATLGESDRIAADPCLAQARTAARIDDITASADRAWMTVLTSTVAAAG